MKIQCDSCGRAEAKVLCCADEAVLCDVCDEAVHGANKLSSKHQRVPLVKHPLSSAAALSPSCDICQKRKGYIFCLEDRALLCRNCDVGTHNANPYNSAHRRFLITGVQVGLQSFSSSDSPSGVGDLQVRQEEEITQGHGDMGMDLTVSSTDTTTEFSSLQQHTDTSEIIEQWPAVQDILNNNVFDYSFDFSDMRSG
ncbi:unnamed protein product [Rhodiola kirilowii]